MTKTIRKITAVDALEYQKVVHQAYQAVTELGIHFAAASADLNTVQNHINSNLVYGLFIDNQLACTLSLRLPWGNNPGPYGVPHIGWVATHPDFKKQGLAAQLLKWVEQEVLAALKVPFVTLGTAENHPWLANFYFHQGFEVVGRADLTPDHTTIYYRKILNPMLFELWSTHHPNRIKFNSSL
ncbi:GNAT family N-acetyltransferase [Lonepinella sp. BR2357]|uniref:GNAT family N-acetyltransferase n=1 Tax=Lonepinella sp. BR2357 TaxID=3434549 RepID=UPI003F6DDD44